MWKTRMISEIFHFVKDDKVLRRGIAIIDESFHFVQDDKVF